MNGSQENQTFQYTYSASEQEEIKHIRSKYMPREETKMDRLRHLDARASHKANMYAMIVGVTGTLILGIGMCCCMVWAERFFVLGIIVGIVGMVILAIAYPLYDRILKKERERIAPEILRLTEELMK